VDLDPTDPTNHSVKGLWVFEALARSRAHVVEWGTPVRIRHVASGRYLAVDTGDAFLRVRTLARTHGVKNAPFFQIRKGTFPTLPSTLLFACSRAEKLPRQQVPAEECSSRITPHVAPLVYQNQVPKSSEVWYRTFLVDDATTDEDALEDGGLAYADPDALVFYIVRTHSDVHFRSRCA